MPHDNPVLTRTQQPGFRNITGIFVGLRHNVSGPLPAAGTGGGVITRLRRSIGSSQQQQGQQQQQQSRHQQSGWNPLGLLSELGPAAAAPALAAAGGASSARLVVEPLQDPTEQLPFDLGRRGPSCEVRTPPATAPASAFAAAAAQGQHAHAAAAAAGGMAAGDSEASPPPTRRHEAPPQPHARSTGAHAHTTDPMQQQQPQKREERVQSRHVYADAGGAIYGGGEQEQEDSHERPAAELLAGFQQWGGDGDRQQYGYPQQYSQQQYVYPQQYSQQQQYNHLPPASAGDSPGGGYIKVGGGASSAEQQARASSGSPRWLAVSLNSARSLTQPALTPTIESSNTHTINHSRPTPPSSSASSGPPLSTTPRPDCSTRPPWCGGGGGGRLPVPSESVPVAFDVLLCASCSNVGTNHFSDLIAPAPSHFLLRSTSSSLLFHFGLAEGV
jgi:hypothetical protein